MKKFWIIFLLCISTCDLYSQSKTIKGRVISDSFETIPGVLIKFNDTVCVGSTDLNGYFEIDIPKNITRLEFDAIGAEPTVIQLTDKCDEADVLMMLASSYDFLSPKKVDRRRMKRFKKLAKLHKEAFDKGLIKTDVACYTRVFVTYW